MASESNMSLSGNTKQRQILKENSAFLNPRTSDKLTQQGD